MVSRVYLAGPIKGLTFDGATEWRETVKMAVRNAPWIETFSPMRGKEHDAIKKQTGEDGTIQDSYEGNPMTSEKGINTRDFNDVKRADLIFVNLLGAKEISKGTIMEIAWAKAFQKPVILVMEKGNPHTHPMLVNACGFIIDDLEKGINIMISVLSSDAQLDILNHAVDPKDYRPDDAGILTISRKSD